MQAAQDEPEDPSPTGRELRSPLQKKTTCQFIYPVFLTSFLQTRSPLCKLFTVMPNLCYVLEGLGAANRRQTSVIELLRSIVGFDRALSEGLAGSHQGEFQFVRD